jgi:hypothetical protein
MRITRHVGVTWARIADAFRNGFAAILVPCICLSIVSPASGQASKRLFDGATLKGWKVLGNGSWTVKGGEIEAKLAKSEPRFTHLVHDTVVKDFRASFLFKGVKGNAGFFFRLQNVGTDPESVSGVQVVVEPTMQAADAFGLYETNGREWIKRWNYAKHNNQYPNSLNCMMKADAPKPIAGTPFDENNCRKTLLDPGGWNRISVWAKGPRLIVKLNMRTIVDTVDAKLDRPGKFAFKLHGGQDVEIRFKDVEIAPWPELAAGLKTKLTKALLYKGEAASPPQLREFLKEVAVENGIALDEGVESAFSKQNLAGYQAALFLSDYNINFNASQRTDFQDWYKQNHGAICLHACTRQEVSMAWPFWGQISGSKLADHSAFIERTVALDPEAARRTVWKGFDAKPYKWRDEWYFWTENPRGKQDVDVILAYADEGPTGDKAPKGMPHAWVAESQGGRFFAWGAGHTMNPLEIPFTYDFLLHALWDVGGYDSVAIGIARPGERSVQAVRVMRAGSVIRLQGEEPFSVEARSVSGSLVFRGDAPAGGNLEFNPGAAPGLIILTVVSGGRATTGKMWVSGESVSLR